MPGFTLVDYIAHAQMTGRRVLGLADHVEFYNGDYPFTNDDREYPLGAAGLWAFRKAADALKERFPKMKLFFAPEYLSGLQVDTLDDRWLGMADIILCEMEYRFSGWDEILARTREAVRILGQLAQVSGATKKPAALVHPFREVINRRVYEAKRVDPEIARLLKPGTELNEDQVDQVFQFDLRALGKASRLTGVPLEINGFTLWRIRKALPELYPVYVQAYRIMHEEGARFIPGTDQHNIDEFDLVKGWTQPFDELGDGAMDKGFLEKIGLI